MTEQSGSSRDEQLDPETAILVKALIIDVNRRQYPPGTLHFKVPVLKPIDWASVDDQTTSGEMPYYTFHFRRDHDLQQFRFWYIED